MQHNCHVLEVAIFKVKPAHAGHITALRAGVREALQSFPGLIEFAGYQASDAGMYADIVKWETQAHAMAAAQAFESGDPRFQPYMQAIEQVAFMGHFAPDPA